MQVDMPDIGSLDADENQAMQAEVPKTATLISMDKVKIENVPRSICVMSDLINTMLTDDPTAGEYELPSVSSVVLKQAIDYMTYHENIAPEEIEKPIKSTSMHDMVCKWDADFVNLEQAPLFQLILGANYLSIKPLLNLACVKVASMIKGKTTEQIRKEFGIINDFTPEEEAQVIAENKWAEEI